MDNRLKMLLFFGAILLLIFLVLSDIGEYDDQQDSINNTKKNTTNNNIEEVAIPLRGNNVTIDEYQDDPYVKAFRGLFSYEFDGRWDLVRMGQSKLPHDPIDSGKFRFKFNAATFGLASLEDTMTPRAVVKITEGDYLDDQIHLIEYTELLWVVLDVENQMYNITDKHVNITNFKQLDLQEYTECGISISINLSNIIKPNASAPTEDGYMIVTDAELPVTILSEDCDFAIKAVVSIDDDVEERQEKRAINYSLILTFIAIANLYSTAQMIRQAIETPAKASQISLISVGLMLIWDSYICIAHLYLALDIEQLFQFLMIPTFWYFILASVFEAKLLILIWRARYWNRFETQEQGRRALGFFYLKLHASMVIIIYLFYEYVFYNWFILLMSFYMIPQIVHSAMQGGRMAFDKNYLFLFAGLRTIIPLYYRGWPSNILNLRPSYWFCLALILVMGLQFLVIYLQSTNGARFFVPARFLPPQYNYLVDVSANDLESGIETDDCAVCMTPLHHDTEPPVESDNSRVILNILKPHQGQIMKPPCGHKFHVKCLVEWMNVKMECPTCRAPLPNIE